MTTARNVSRRLVRVSLTALAVALSPTLAFAQTASPAASAEDAGINEIIVTAQRREQNLQAVPISVSAFGAEQIAKKGLTDLSRLEGLVPGFTFGRSGVDARPAIRGVRTENVDVNADTTIGFYIDGIYQSRASQGTLGFVDLERVEVQRGPQGTLYGRNTFGGNIAIATAQPSTEKFTGGGDVTVGSNAQTRFTGYINAPLGDTVAVRLAGGYEKSNGYVKNVNPTGGNLFDDDNTYFRGAIKFKPDSNLTATLKFDYASRGGNGGSAFGYKLVGSYFYVPTNTQLFNATPVILNTRGGNRDGIIDAPLTIDAGVPLFAPGNPYLIDNDYRGSLNLKNYSGTGDIAYNFGPVTLKSITGYTDFKTTRTQDTDFSGSQIGADYQFTSAKTFSQEVQLLSNGKGPLEYVLGAYYFKDKLNGTFINQQFVQVIPNDTRPPAVRQAGGSYTQNQAETRSLAFYGQASYKLADRLKLTGGIRWTRDSKDFRFANANSVLPLVSGVPDATAITLATGGIPDNAYGVKGGATNCTYVTIPTPLPGFQCLAANTTIFTGATYDTAKFEKVTWRVGLDYQVSDQSLLYGSASTGFNSGGFNGSQTAVALGRSTFAPQSVTAFEIGSKNRFANNTVQLNLALFYNKYNNLQEQRQVPVGNTTLSIIENSGKARSYGAELEAIWKPVKALTFNASFSYLNARYTQYDQVAAPFGTSILVPDATATAPTVVNGVTIAPAGQRRLFAVGYNCGLIPGTGGTGQPAAAYGCNLAGNRIAYSPDYSGAVSVQYDIDLGSGGKLSPYAQLNFSGAFFGQPINSILDRQPAFAKLDLRLTWEYNEQFSLQTFVTNVTNKATATRFVYGGGGNLQASYAPPRLWGMRGSVKF
ncbi:TonB-dependent receptor [Novosphingobium sp.]|uniref:TonB-dependent receptor n=1 Tax=Novosphingobium sp. TaxID=1874826 RepID=UPI0025EC2E79|nr:TonB-dependent receptor [Novosphingobium sp.]